MFAFWQQSFFTCQKTFLNICSNNSENIFSSPINLIKADVFSTNSHLPLLKNLLYKSWISVFKSLVDIRISRFCNIGFELTIWKQEQNKMSDVKPVCRKPQPTITYPNFFPVLHNTSSAAEIRQETFPDDDVSSIPDVESFISVALPVRSTEPPNTAMVIADAGPSSSSGGLPTVVTASHSSSCSSTRNVTTVTTVTNVTQAGPSTSSLSNLFTAPFGGVQAAKRHVTDSGQSLPSLNSSPRRHFEELEDSNERSFSGHPRESGEGIEARNEPAIILDNPNDEDIENQTDLTQTEAQSTQPPKKKKTRGVSSGFGRVLEDRSQFEREKISAVFDIRKAAANLDVETKTLLKTTITEECNKIKEIGDIQLANEKKKAEMEQEILSIKKKTALVEAKKIALEVLRLDGRQGSTDGITQDVQSFLNNLDKI
jgi:hypothetical protein